MRSEVASRFRSGLRASAPTTAPLTLAADEEQKRGTRRLLCDDREQSARTLVDDHVTGRASVGVTFGGVAEPDYLPSIRHTAPGPLPSRTDRRTAGGGARQPEALDLTGLRLRASGNRGSFGLRFGIPPRRSRRGRCTRWTRPREPALSQRRARAGRARAGGRAFRGSASRRDVRVAVKVGRVRSSRRARRARRGIAR